MKKRVIVFLMLFMLALSATACRKNKDTAETPEVPVVTSEESSITVEESAAIELGEEEQGAFAPE